MPDAAHGERERHEAAARAKPNHGDALARQLGKGIFAQIAFQCDPIYRSCRLSLSQMRLHFAHEVDQAMVVRPSPERVALWGKGCEAFQRRSNRLLSSGRSRRALMGVRRMRGMCAG